MLKLVRKLNWSVAKIVQQRTPDAPKEGCPDEMLDPSKCVPAPAEADQPGEALRPAGTRNDAQQLLDRATQFQQQLGVPGAPGNQGAPAIDPATGRPCGEDEAYPDKCSGPGSQPAAPSGGGGAPGGGGLQGPMSDDPKLLRKMSGKPPPTPPKGLEGPTQDPQREQRNAQNVSNLKRASAEGNPERTSWAMDKIMPGKGKPDGKGNIVGGGPASSPEEGKSRYEDATHSLQNAGYEETSRMGNSSTWSSGRSAVSVWHGPDAETGGYSTRYKVKGPPQAPKKKGLFRR